MKKPLPIILVVIIAAILGWYLLSPLFFNKTVHEGFPSGQTSQGPKMGNDLVQLPPQSEIDQMSDQARQAVEQSIVDRLRNEQPTSVSDSMDQMNGPEGAAPTLLSEGTFKGVVHSGSGDAKLYQILNDGNVVRLENLNVTNGPDLYVYLVADPVPTTNDQVTADFVNLGALKGNVGDQNYTVPDSVDVSKYHSVVIWCRAFSVLFASASLK